ncbi:hypothetical protein TKK_0012200 [Trichogramma kaykai]|uniref:Uncharacterized protein n=1 Tax=Trichogramma kaykai TaxID=54128 RepID=A0ABD2WMN0_9HYME
MNEKQSPLSPLMIIEPVESLHGSKPISDTVLNKPTQHRRPCQTQEVVEINDEDDDDEVQFVEMPQDVVEISSDEEISLQDYNDNRSQQTLENVISQNMTNKSQNPIEDSLFCSLVISEVTSLSKEDFETAGDIPIAKMQYNTFPEVHQSQDRKKQRIIVDDPEAMSLPSPDTKQRRIELLASACNMLLLQSADTNEHRRTISTNSSKNFDSGNPPSPTDSEITTEVTMVCDDNKNQQNYRKKEIKREDIRKSVFVGVRDDDYIDSNTNFTHFNEFACDRESDDNEKSEKKIDARKDQVSLQSNDSNKNPVENSNDEIIPSNNDESSLCNSRGSFKAPKRIYIEGKEYLVLDDWLDQSYTDNTVDNTSNEFFEKIVETSMIVSGDTDPHWSSNGELWDTDEQILINQSSKNDVSTIAHDAANSSSFSVASTQHLVITEIDEQHQRSFRDDENMHESNDLTLAGNANIDSSTVHTRTASQVSDDILVRNDESCEIRCDLNVSGYYTVCEQAVKRQPEILRRDATKFIVAEQKIDRKKLSVHNERTRYMCRKNRHDERKNISSHIKSNTVITRRHANGNPKSKIVKLFLLLKKSNKRSTINLRAQFFLDMNFVKLMRQFNQFYQFARNFYNYNLLQIHKGSLEINGQLKKIVLDKALRYDKEKIEKKIISQKMMIMNLPDENQNSFCKSYYKQPFHIFKNGKRKYKSDDNRSISSIGDDEPRDSEYSDTEYSANECPSVSKVIPKIPICHIPCKPINKEPSENIVKKKRNRQTHSEMKLTLKRDGFNHGNWIALPKENYVNHDIILNKNENFSKPQEKVLQTNIKIAQKIIPELDSNSYAPPIERNSYNITLNLSSHANFSSKSDNQRNNNIQAEKNSKKFYQSSECQKEHILKDFTEKSNNNKENEYLSRDQSIKKQEEKFSSDHNIKKQGEPDNEPKNTTLIQLESKEYSNFKLVAKNEVIKNSDAHKATINIQIQNPVYSEIQKKCLSDVAPPIMVPDKPIEDTAKVDSYNFNTLESHPADDSDDENRLTIDMDNFENDSACSKHLNDDDGPVSENNSCINKKNDIENDVANSAPSHYNKNNQSCTSLGYLKESSKIGTNSETRNQINKQEDSLDNVAHLTVDKTGKKMINRNDQTIEEETRIMNQNESENFNKKSVFFDLDYFGDGIFECLPEYHTYGIETRQKLISEYNKFYYGTSFYEERKKSKLIKINNKKAILRKRKKIKTNNDDEVVEPPCKNLKLDQPDINLDQCKSIQSVTEHINMEGMVSNEKTNYVSENETPLEELEGGDFDFNYSQIVQNKEFSDKNLSDDYCMSDEETSDNLSDQSNLISVETVNHDNENFVNQNNLLEKNLCKDTSNGSAILSSVNKEIEKLNDKSLNDSFKIKDVPPKKNSVNGQENQLTGSIIMQGEIIKFNSKNTGVKIYIDKDRNAETFFEKSIVPNTNAFLNSAINHASNKTNLVSSETTINDNLSEEARDIFSSSSTQTSKQKNIQVTNSEKILENTIKSNTMAFSDGSNICTFTRSDHKKSEPIIRESNHGIIENIVHSDSLKKDYCDLNVLSRYNLVLETLPPSNESMTYNEEYYTYHFMLDSLMAPRNFIVQSNPISVVSLTPSLSTRFVYQPPLLCYISSNQSVSNGPVTNSSTNSSPALSTTSTMTNESRILPRVSPMSNNVLRKSTTLTTSPSMSSTVLSTLLNKHPSTSPMCKQNLLQVSTEPGVESIIIRASDICKMNEGKSISERKEFRNQNFSKELETITSNQSGTYYLCTKELG